MPPPVASPQRYAVAPSPASSQARAPAPTPSQIPNPDQRPELPSLASIQRPGSGMPIWSMIDSDAPRPTRGPAPQGPPLSSNQAAATAMPAPQYPLAASSHRASGSWDHSPNNTATPLPPTDNAYQNRPRVMRTGSAGSPPSSYIGSPERSRAGSHQPMPLLPDNRGRDDSHNADYNRRFDMRFQSVARHPAEHLPPRSFSQASDASVHGLYVERFGGRITPANGDGMYGRDRSDSRDNSRDGPGVMSDPRGAMDREAVDRLMHSGRQTTSPSGHPGPSSPTYQTHRPLYAGQEAIPGPHDPGAYATPMKHERPSEPTRSFTPASGPGPRLETLPNHDRVATSFTSPTARPVPPYHGHGPASRDGSSSL